MHSYKQKESEERRKLKAHAPVLFYRRNTTQLTIISNSVGIVLMLLRNYKEQQSLKAGDPRF